jgi:phage-related protein
MGLWDKLKESQKNFDEQTIDNLAQHYITKYMKLSKKELELELAKLEQEPAFQQEKAMERAFLFGVYGAATHINEREREGRKKAIKICLQVTGDDEET